MLGEGVDVGPPASDIGRVDGQSDLGAEPFAPSGRSGVSAPAPARRQAEDPRRVRLRSQVRRLRSPRAGSAGSSPGPGPVRPFIDASAARRRPRGRRRRRGPNRSPGCTRLRASIRLAATSAGSPSTSITAAAMSCGSVDLATKRSPSPATTSGLAPTGVTTTGVPHDIASAVDSPKPSSCRVGVTTRSAVRYQVRRSSSDTRPSRCTEWVRPRSGELLLDRATSGSVAGDDKMRRWVGAQDFCHGGDKQLNASALDEASCSHDQRSRRRRSVAAHPSRGVK